MFIRHPFHLVVITNRTPVYRKQLSPIPALAAGDWLGDVVNDLKFSRCLSGHKRMKRSQIDNEFGKLFRDLF